LLGRCAKELLERNLDLARVATLSQQEAFDEVEWQRLVAAAPPAATGKPTPPPSLPDLQRRVIELRFGEEKSIRDIAAALGRSEGAVKQLQLRALENLRKELRHG
jgi:DNA-directed RNA polymerase sigma subunit (sigma70/sigma32)